MFKKEEKKNMIFTLYIMLLYFDSQRLHTVQLIEIKVILLPQKKIKPWNEQWTRLHTSIIMNYAKPEKI